MQRDALHPLTEHWQAVALPMILVDTDARFIAGNAAWDDLVHSLQPWLGHLTEGVQVPWADTSTPQHDVDIGPARVCVFPKPAGDAVAITLTIDTERSTLTRFMGTARTSVQQVGTSLANAVGALDEVSHTLDAAARRAQEDVKQASGQWTAFVDRVADLALDVQTTGIAATQGVDASLTRSDTLEHTARASVGEVSDMVVHAEEVGKLAKSVDRIMGTTRMLSLNARVEAARAGPYGRSFAVVADEVAELATETTQVANAIQHTVQQILSRAPALQQAMHDVRDRAQESRAQAEQLRDTMRTQADAIQLLAADVAPTGDLRAHMRDRLARLDATAQHVQRDAAHTRAAVETTQTHMGTLEILAGRFGHMSQTEPADVFQLVDSLRLALGAVLPEAMPSPVPVQHGQRPQDVFVLLQEVHAVLASLGVPVPPLPSPKHGPVTPNQVHGAAYALLSAVRRHLPTWGVDPTTVPFAPPVLDKSPSDVFAKLCEAATLCRALAQR